MRDYELFRTADVDDGFLVAQVSRARGYFSVTGSVYSSREAYELGNEWVHSSGCLHEQIAAALPELQPLIALHLTPTNADTDEARAANEWVDAHKSDTAIPADIPSGPEWAHTFSTGVRVVSKLTGSVYDAIGGHYTYKVVVTANGHTYTAAQAQGSAADHGVGLQDARELAFLVLRELCDFLYESTEEVARDYGLDPEDEGHDKTLAAMRRAEHFADNVRDQLEPLREVLS